MYDSQFYTSLLLDQTLNLSQHNNFKTLYQIHSIPYNTEILPWKFIPTISANILIYDYHPFESHFILHITITFHHI